ncbi:50S ribosomal protein L28 [soil metagenome]
MSICELTGKRPVVKNLVSHSNIKTKKIAQPNVQKRRLFSAALGDLVTLRIATSAIRDMEHVGGLDRFILRQDDKKLSSRALDVKRRIVRKLTRKPGQAKAAKTASAGKA